MTPEEAGHCEWYMAGCHGPDWDRAGISYFVLRGGPPQWETEPDLYLWDGEWHRLPPEESARLWEMVRGLEDHIYPREGKWQESLFHIDVVALAWFSGQPWEEA